jgi:hypothetical protein
MNNTKRMKPIMILESPRLTKLMKSIDNQVNVFEKNLTFEEIIEELNKMEKNISKYKDPRGRLKILKLEGLERSNGDKIKENLIKKSYSRTLEKYEIAHQNKIDKRIKETNFNDIDQSGEDISEIKSKKKQIKKSIEEILLTPGKEYLNKKTPPKKEISKEKEIENILKSIEKENSSGKKILTPGSKSPIDINEKLARQPLDEFIEKLIKKQEKKKEISKENKESGYESSSEKRDKKKRKAIKEVESFESDKETDIVKKVKFSYKNFAEYIMNLYDLTIPDLNLLLKNKLPSKSSKRQIISAIVNQKLSERKK